MRNIKKRSSQNFSHHRAQSASGATGGKQQQTKSWHPGAGTGGPTEPLRWIDYNENFLEAVKAYFAAGHEVNEEPGPHHHDLWIFKVIISHVQAMLAFFSGGTFHIGFLNESYKNLSLPFTCPAEEIFAHIERNKKDNNLTAEDCVSAIGMLQFLLTVNMQIQALDSEKLQEVAERLYRKWNALNQHRVTLAISGALAQARHTQEEVESLFRAIYHDQDDPELKAVLGYVSTAFKRHRQGKPALPLEELRKEQFLNPRVTEELIQILSQD